MAALPDMPPLVAVIAAVPGVNPDSNPFPDTIATAALLDAHVTVGPVNTFPPASLSVTVNCCVPPTDWLAAAGVTATDATTTGGGVAPLTRPVATVKLSTHIV
jgi:hypothetical protein